MTLSSSALWLLLAHGATQRLARNACRSVKGGSSSGSSNGGGSSGKGKKGKTKAASTPAAASLSTNTPTTPGASHAAATTSASTSSTSSRLLSALAQARQDLAAAKSLLPRSVTNPEGAAAVNESLVELICLGGALHVFCTVSTSGMLLHALMYLLSSCSMLP